MANIFTEIEEKLGKLRRNEEQMSEEQKKKFEKQLKALKIKIAKDATEICKGFILSGILILKEDESDKVIDRINMILAEEKAKGTLKEASRILFPRMMWISSSKRYARYMTGYSMKGMHLTGLIIALCTTKRECRRWEKACFLHGTVS